MASVRNPMHVADSAMEGAVINPLGEEELWRSYIVQGQKRTEYEILVLAIEHFGYHTGQFAWFGKYLFDGEIDLFKGRNLDIE